MLAERRRLPVYQHRDDVLDTFHRHNVFIVAGETGSGKSTQVPQFILEVNRLIAYFGLENSVSRMWCDVCVCETVTPLWHHESQHSTNIILYYYIIILVLLFFNLNVNLGHLASWGGS